MKKIFVLIFLISIISVISLIGLKNLEERKVQQGKAILIIKTLGETIEEEIDVGESVLNILMEKHDVETIQTASSKLIKCIDKVCSKNQIWWKMIVNDERVLMSADKYYPKDRDKILLDYGEFQ